MGFRGKKNCKIASQREREINSKRGFPDNVLPQWLGCHIEYRDDSDDRPMG